MREELDDLPKCFKIFLALEEKAQRDKGEAKKERPS